MTKREQEALDRVARDPRRQWGWEPSPMASVEEQRAYKAYQLFPEIEAGRATTADLPAEYGGFPTGSSRRDIRMRDEWIARENARMKLEEEERERQKFIEESIKKDQMFQLEFSSKEYDLRTRQNETIFNLRKDADLKQAEAEFTEFRNQLDPNNPASVGALYSYISSDPRLANSKVAYTSSDFFGKSAQNSARSLNIQTNRAIQDKVSEARSLGISDREIDSAKTLDQSGAETFDMGKIQYMIDTTKGQRLVEAEKRREPEDIRTPFQKAQDDYAIATARLGAYLDEDGLPFDEESEVYRRAKADVLEAETRIKRSERTEAAPRLTEEERPRFSQEQIDEARRIAREPRNPRSRAAIRLLNSIGESY